MKTKHLIAILAFLLVCSTSFATTRYLAANSNSADFQNLVNQSAANDVIVLQAGSHYITNPILLDVGKDYIKIQGDTGAVLRKAYVSPAQPGIIVRSNFNTFTNVEMDGGMLGEAGVHIYGGANVFDTCNFHHFGGTAGNGLLFHLTVYNTVKNTYVHDCDHVGISQYGHAGGNLDHTWVWDTGAEGITVDCGSDGTKILSCVVIRANKLHAGCGGVGIDDSNNVQIAGLKLDTVYGASGVVFNNQVGGCDSCVVIYSQLYNCQGWGILSEENPYYTTNSAIGWNTFMGNWYSPDVYFR